MAFDPTIPAVNADLDADPIRDNFNALKGLIDAIPTSGQTPGGSAGGDLGGTYPNPTVQSIANVTVGPAVYPAGDGSQLTNLPAAPATLKSGTGSLDGSGVLDLSGATSATFAIGSWYGSSGTGRIITMGAPLRIASDAGATDAGLTVCWISF